jgi:hypothetical protein
LTESGAGHKGRWPARLGLRLGALAAQARLRLCRGCSGFKRLAEKAREPSTVARGSDQTSSYPSRERLNAGMALQPGPDANELRHVSAVAISESGGCSSEPLQHGAFRRDDFLQIAVRENQTVLLRRLQERQQLSPDFHGFAAGRRQPGPPSGMQAPNRRRMSPVIFQNAMVVRLRMVTMHP